MTYGFRYELAAVLLAPVDPLINSVASVTVTRAVPAIFIS